jgi:hypothetical protein
MDNEYTKQEKEDFEIAVRKLEGKCIACNIQWADNGTDYCGVCRAEIRVKQLRTLPSWDGDAPLISDETNSILEQCNKEGSIVLVTQMLADDMIKKMNDD